MKLGSSLLFLTVILAVCAFATAAASKTGPSQAGDPALALFYQQKLMWKACGKGFQCAKATVPVDYAKPGGPTLELALKRLAGAKSATRTLFINPGGPGEPGTGEFDEPVGNTTVTVGAALRKAIGKQYSIVGFDPRGVGGSSPLDCLTDAQLDALYQQPGVPATVAAKKKLVSEIKSFARACQRKAGALAAHVSTVEVAKDLDVLRAAVGDQKLNFLGSSYGTAIGSTYAQLFPKLVGRMVLDGAEDPNLRGIAAQRSQVAGLQIALKAYVSACVAKGADCPLGASVDEVMQKIVKLVQGLATNPMPSGDPKRPLNDQRAILGIVATLYSPDTWGYLTGALNSAFTDRDGSVLAQYADLYVGREKTGYQANGNLFESNAVITCLDSASRAGIAPVEKAVPSFRAVSPVFGPWTAWGSLACEVWPTKATNPRPAVHLVGAPPILVVGTTRDNATPYKQAVALTKALETATLLTYDGDGHLAYLRNYPCIDKWVNRYFLTGKTPPKATRCST
jgi:pimeloyl-ACP methyl ester carboxylesterase